MLIEELFAQGIMTMGPSRKDPSCQVGVLTPKAIEIVRTEGPPKISQFRWIVGEWRYENLVPATSLSPAYADTGTQRFTISEKGGWVCSVSPDGSEQQCITYDPFSRQWIYVLTRGSFGMLRSKDGWVGNEIAFSGLMTMIGIDCEWRMTWIKVADNEFRFVNEERLSDGSWAYIDEWQFHRIGTIPKDAAEV